LQQLSRNRQRDRFVEKAVDSLNERILIVDDEPGLVKGLTLTLEQAGYQVESLGRGDDVLPRLAQGGIDLVLLDVMLPGKDGITVCRDLRAQGSQIPVIMLSARGEALDRILGLEIGADDYIVKPFHGRELIARIKAVLRRGRSLADQPLLRFPDFTIDLNRRLICKGEEELELTAKEFDLLILLATHPGRIYTREQLLQNVWDYDFAGDTRTVDVHVHRLRDKLEPEPSRPIYLLTARGHGYYWREER
jgi:two-component system response regulator VicR